MLASIPSRLLSEWIAFANHEAREAEGGKAPEPQTADEMQSMLKAFAAKHNRAPIGKTRGDDSDS